MHTQPRSSASAGACRWRWKVLLAGWSALCTLATVTIPDPLAAQSAGVDTVIVPNGSLRLRGLLFRPSGPGPFPAVLFNHGSGGSTTTEEGRRDQRNRARQAMTLGPVFARHGYAFLFLFRRGAGLSMGQGSCSGDLMDSAQVVEGQAGRNRVQLRLIEHDELSDVVAGLVFLRGLADVDRRRLVVAGHSFGGSLTLLAAERDTGLAAAVDFAGAARSWDGSPELRARLIEAVRHARAPIMILHARNDYSIAPARVLGAELRRLGKPYGTRIYPACGRSALEGHSWCSSPSPAGKPTSSPSCGRFRR